MGLYVTALNSGSNGNCYYIGNDEEAVFVDAGISCREIEKRMKKLELSMNKVKAIFVSHEHADHVRGIRVLSKKYSIPVYISRLTLQHARLNPENPLFIDLNAQMPINIGELTVKAFPKLHDASDPHSFVISNGSATVGVMTDIGLPCDNVVNHFKQCHAVFLETNYDEEMLIKGNYPLYLKRRIGSELGHLSNQQAFELFTNHRPHFLSHLFLCHLSKDNNTPERAVSLFKTNANGTEVVMTSRTEATPIYEISGN